MAGLLLRRSEDRADAFAAVDGPALNFLPALGAVDDGGPVLQVPGAGCLALSRDQVGLMRHVVHVGVRPAHWLMTPGEGADGLHARIDRVEPRGAITRVHCRLRGAHASAASVVVETAWPGSETLPRGLRVRLQARPWHLVLFDAQGRALAA